MASSRGKGRAIFSRGACVVLALLFPAALNATTVEPSAHGVELRDGTVRVRVTALSPRVLRVRYAPQGEFPPEHSFAVLPDAFPEAPAVRIRQDAQSVFVDAGSVTARIGLSPISITFLDARGQVVSQDLPGQGAVFEGPGFRVRKSMPEDEHYFALGDKAGPLDHRGQAFTMWNTDAFGWQESTDPLYKSIPFLLALRRGAAYGVFLDNTYRTWFDLGKTSRDSYSFGADGGELDYYFFYGPRPKRVLEDFTALVGRTPLPPLFSLGYQQCRYSYYPEARVRALAGEFRKRRIPADVIYLDIDYQQDNRPFTVDRERFPHFAGMVQDLAREGFKIVAITDLHLARLPGYKPFDEGARAGYFVKNPDGTVYVGKVWPGESVFPDFTRAEVRAWWGGLYREFVKAGIRGFWNDMNEPAIFERADKTMPLGTVHDVDGRKTDHREIHNAFGMENARATYEGLLRLVPGSRPFVLTRAAYAGAQRYAASWTGDNSSTWNHMRLSTPQLINLGLSGYAFVGDDIGGFNGSPTPELLTRWMELGAFNPVYRNHAMKGSRDREPWVDGPEHEMIRRRYIEARYRLLPYIYTEMERTSRTGVPLMRPLFLDFPDDPASTVDDEFLFGERLLVAPKAWEFAAPYDVRLPAGDWYDYWTGRKIPGGRSISVDPPLDTLPVYVRAGTILPQQPVVQDTAERPRGPLELRVYPGPDCGGELYMDDGESFAYRKGKTLRVRFQCEAAADHLDITLSAPEGPYRPWFTDVAITAFGTGPIAALDVDGRKVSGWKTEGEAVTLPSLAWSAGAHRIRLLYSH